MEQNSISGAFYDSRIKYKREDSIMSQSPCLVCTLWLACAVLAAAALVAAVPGPALVQPGAVPRGAALPASGVTHLADAETLIRVISAYILLETQFEGCLSKLLAVAVQVSSLITLSSKAGNKGLRSFYKAHC